MKEFHHIERVNPAVLACLDVDIQQDEEDLRAITYAAALMERHGFDEDFPIDIGGQKARWGHFIFKTHHDRIRSHAAWVAGITEIPVRINKRIGGYHEHGT